MDRFYRGFTAGVVGGIAMNIWSLISYHILNLTNVRFLDWAGIMIYGNIQVSLFQQVHSLVMHLFWAGFLGILFAYLIPITTGRGYLGKGVIFSVISGFIIYTIPVLFKAPILADVDTATSASNHFGGLIWGIVVAYTLRVLDQKEAHS